MNQDSIIRRLIFRNEVKIAPGVTHVRCAFYDTDEHKVESYILYVDMKGSPVHIDSALPDNGDAWGMQKTTQMAKAASSKGHQVVGAVNGDFYTMTSGEPEGVFVKKGKIFKDTMKVGKNFFGIKKDNTPVIGDELLFQSIKGELKTSVGGRSQLIKKCELNHAQIDEEIVHHPRTAVGILPDGTVMFVVIDGRQPGFSEGFDLPKLARYMKALGAVDALNLDGGGSSTFALRVPGTDELKMVNSTSDGEERTTANSILVVSTAKEDHQFVNAHIDPFEIAIAPGGYVDFNGKGKDASGASAAMPTEGLSWLLSDTEYGTIDNKGHFISSGKEGYVEVILKYNSSVVGKTGLKIVVPDQLFFEIGPEVIISKKAKKDLKLLGKYQGRNVRVLPNQVEWTIPEEIGYIDENGLLRTGNQNGEGIVHARLKMNDIFTDIKVKVALLPVVLYDFEDIYQVKSWCSGMKAKDGSCSVKEAIYPTEPVKTGDKSLKLSFKFENTENDMAKELWVGPVAGKEEVIPDRPMAIGMWVYVTEEVQGFHLKGKLVDGNNAIIYLDYTSKHTGIDWTGWKYVEAEITTDYKAPLTFYPGESIGLVCLSNEKISGVIYIDNIRSVYTDKDDDPISPSVKLINVDGKTFDTDMVNIVVWLEKKSGYKYATKINYNRIRIFVDDTEYTNLQGHYGINKGNSTVMLSGISYSKGIHKVKIWFQDCFGNEAYNEAFFTVSV